MAHTAHQLGVYLHLAQASQRRQRPLVRGRMLLLAAVAATELKLPSLAAYCRHEILRHNPNHLLRKWDSLPEALEEEDFATYLKQAQRRYPTEKAERMLDSLGLQMAHERETYYTTLEYAAAILGITTDELDGFRGSSESI